jgi:hypothetical protein
MFGQRASEAPLDLVVALSDHLSRMQKAFTILERFDPTWDRWPSYIAFSKLAHLTEVVSLDALLCRGVVGHELLDEEWSHYLPEIDAVDAFDDVDWLVARHPVGPKEQLLQFVLEPDRDAESALNDERWEFIGYDLINKGGRNSALTNCGGFDDVFLPKELNDKGLVTSFAEAQRIRAELLEKYPEEHHANCTLYAIWRALFGHAPRL